MMQELVQNLQNMARDMVNSIHTALPGTIVSFDPETGLAEVRPSLKYRKPDGTSLDYPNITGVPVYFPQGAAQQASIAYPVREGDGCLLIASEQALDYWMYGRQTATELRYDLTNSIALAGLFVRAGPGVRKACAENAVVVMAGDTCLTVKPGGAEITGSLKVSGDMIVQGVSFMGHTHQCPNGGDTGGPS